MSDKVYKIKWIESKDCQPLFEKRISRGSTADIKVNETVFGKWMFAFGERSNKIVHQHTEILFYI